VIVDATFLHREHRQIFYQLARRLEVPFRILSFDAPEPTLRQRLLRRAATAEDASEADLEVLRQQRDLAEPLAPEEQATAICVNSLDARAEDWLREQVQSLVDSPSGSLES
jgi:predicted kinase